MTCENVEFVRSIYAAWERGDYSSADWAHPNIECVFVDGPSPGCWRGLTGLARAWRDWLSAWDQWRLRAEDVRELDGERVLVSVRVTGRGRKSGLDVGEMHNEVTTLFHIRDGKVTKLLRYFDRERAYADAGLTAQDNTSDQ
jgi:ketosteroid isomerase-like protein